MGRAQQIPRFRGVAFHSCRIARELVIRLWAAKDLGTITTGNYVVEC